MKRISKKGFEKPVMSGLSIMAGIVLGAILIFIIYNLIINYGINPFKTSIDGLVSCGNPTADGLYETKCYSQEKVGKCGDIGWQPYMELGKAKGCLEDEMCCKRLLAEYAS